MIIISDTSPIINLSIIGQLDLIPQLYKQIVIPKAVFDEIVTNGEGLPGSFEIKNAQWVSVEICQNKSLLSKLLNELDQGEAEAIVLALELKADRILIDEINGREVATRLHLPTLGLLGILLEAKSNHLIPSVKPLMDALRTKARFFIHQSLYNQVLAIAKEEP